MRFSPSKSSPAGGGARTHTALRPLDFESSASANSATPARRILKLRNQKRTSSSSDHRIASYEFTLNRGAGFAGKSGRKTANAWNTNATEMSADHYCTLHFQEYLHKRFPHCGSVDNLRSISSAKRFAWKIPVATHAQYRAVSALTCSPTATGIFESKS